MNCIPCAQGERCGPTGGTFKKPSRRHSQAPETPRPGSAPQNRGLRARSGTWTPGRGNSHFGSCTARGKTESSLRPTGFYDPKATTPPKSLAPLPSAPQNAGPRRHPSVLRREPWESPFCPLHFSPLCKIENPVKALVPSIGDVKPVWRKCQLFNIEILLPNAVLPSHRCGAALR